MSSNYTPPNGSGQGWQYQNGSTGSGQPQPPRRPNFTLREWIPIIILFCIPSGVTQLIAFFWALSKVVNIIKHNKAYQEQLKQFGRSAASAAKEATEAFRQEVNKAQNVSSHRKTETKDTASKAAQSSAKNHSYSGSGRPVPKKKVKIPGGTALVVLGIILACGCGFSALMCMISSSPIGFFVLSLLTLVGLGMLGGGVKLNRRKERCRNYLAYIGPNRQVDLARMAASFGVPVKKLCNDLRWMLAKDILPTGYLDLAAGKLFLTEEGYRAPEPEKAAQEESEEEIKKEDDEILREIRQINAAIPDQVMSAKIDRIEEITGKILAYQKTHPDRSAQLRSFLNYYLPTTLKILRAYAQLDAQGIDGENISATKARIEGMMDQVVAGFEKQLDRLFRDDAMDITSDVQVLESMLRKDGLSDDPQTMTFSR